jgi:hypothetical protein
MAQEIRPGAARSSAVWRVLTVRVLIASAALTLGSIGPGVAQDELEWTVVTVARNGAWGVASASLRSEALATALRRCKSMSAEESDCGAELVSFRSGCALAMLCGDYRVLVSGRDGQEAELLAQQRVFILRELYAPDLPPCRLVLSIDPNGYLTTFTAKAKHAD